MAAKKKSTPKKSTPKKSTIKAAKTTPDPELTLQTIAPVLAKPDDDDLRSVVADALLEQNNPWGELITLQLRIAAKKATPAEKKTAKILARRNLEIICGPIAKVASTKSVVFEKGFLVACAPERRLVPRPDWEAAAAAPHWATVRKMEVSILTTPQWWVTEWARNPATRNMLEIDVSGLIIKRDHPSKPWCVLKCSKHKFYGAYLAAFAKGLSKEEQSRLVLDPSLKAPSREMIEAALAKAGVRRS